MDWISIAVFGFFHATFLFFYLACGYLQEAPMILPLGILMLAADYAIHRSVAERKRIPARQREPAAPIVTVSERLPAAGRLSLSDSVIHSAY
jgi:hypothetical protein